MQVAADYPSLTKEQRLDILVRYMNATWPSSHCAMACCFVRAMTVTLDAATTGNPG